MSGWIAEAKRKAEQQQQELLDSMDRVIAREASLTPDDLRRFGERLDTGIEGE